MRLCAGLSRVEFAPLARPRATSRATDSLYLFESGLLVLHGSFMMEQSGEEKWSILHSDIGWLLKHHYTQMGAFDLPERAANITSCFSSDAPLPWMDVDRNICPVGDLRIIL